MSLLEVTRPDASRSPPTPSDVAAVRGLNFHVESGEVVALVGESGAGKSASAMAVIGLLPEYAEVSGSVRLHGDELHRARRPADVAHPRRQDRHRLPGSDVGADAGLHRRRPDRRGHRGSTSATSARARGPRARRRTARTRRHRPAGATGPRVPARTVRRRTAARRHRDRDRQRPRPAHLRRTHDGAGRHRAGADPRRAADRARRHRRRRADHHPRPRRRRRVRRPRTGDVRGPGGRDGAGRRSVPQTAGCPTPQDCSGSVPRLDAPQGARLVPIPGAPPSLAALPPGCPFAPRCPLAIDDCRTAEPELVAGRARPHRGACIRTDEVAGRSRGRDLRRVDRTAARTAADAGRRRWCCASRIWSRPTS